LAQGSRQLLSPKHDSFHQAFPDFVALGIKVSFLRHQSYFASLLVLIETSWQSHLHSSFQLYSSPVC
jgi:hypothetical protein